MSELDASIESLQKLIDDTEDTHKRITERIRSCRRWLFFNGFAIAIYVTLSLIRGLEGRIGWSIFYGFASGAFMFTFVRMRNILPTLKELQVDLESDLELWNSNMNKMLFYKTIAEGYHL